MRDSVVRPMPYAERACVAMNVVSVAVGGIVMGGWYLESPTIVRIHPSFVPIQFNTALGIAFAGVGLLAGFFARPRLGVAAGALVALIGASSLFQDVSGIRLGTDTLFHDPFVTAMVVPPGRPSPNTSLAFIALGAGIALSVLEGRRRWVRWATGFAGSVAATMGAVPLLGYLTGVQAAFRIVSDSGMAVATAVVFLMAGVSLTITAVRNSQTNAAHRQVDWAPWAAALSVLVAALFLWSGLRTTEINFAQRQLADEARFLRHQLTNPIREDLEALQRLAWRMESRAEYSQAEWMEDAWRHIQTEPYYALLWTDRDLKIRSAVPFVVLDQTGLLRVPAIDDLSNGISFEMAGGRLFRSPIAPLPGGEGLGFYVFLPLSREAATSGYLVALVDFTAIVRPLVDLYRQYDYHFAVFEDGKRLALAARAEQTAHSPDYTITFPAVGRDWRLSLYRTTDAAAMTATALPETVLVLGIVLAVLLGITLRSRQLLAVRATYLTDSQKGLLEQVAQRDETVAHLATHDSSTSLPNRSLFSELLNQALAGAEHHGGRLAVICLAIDHFQDVNNGLGHAAGDALLAAFSARVKRLLGRSDVLARLGGDEFVILCPDMRDSEYAAEVAESLLEAMSESFHVAANDIAVTTSIGVAHYPEAGRSAEALIKNADAAMHQARGFGRNTYSFYGPEVGEAVSKRVSLRRALRDAARNGELRVHYQPKVSLHDRRIVGAEALVRWQRPGHGLVQPGEFIQLAEESNLIVPIDSEVMRLVAADLQRWSDSGLTLPKVSVNTTARQLRGDRLLRDVRDMLDRYPASRGHLELELTERLLIDAVPEHRRLLDALIDLDVTIAIDDFGTGYSSFRYFRDFPIHGVKIDLSFTRDLIGQPPDSRIVSAMLELGKAFNIAVVAEGVEVEEQETFLRTHGCTHAQGWLFGKAVPGDEFFERWRQQLG